MTEFVLSVVMSGVYQERGHVPIPKVRRVLDASLTSSWCLFRICCLVYNKRQSSLFNSSGSGSDLRAGALTYCSPDSYSKRSS